MESLEKGLVKKIKTSQHFLFYAYKHWLIWQEFQKLMARNLVGEVANVNIEVMSYYKDFFALTIESHLNSALFWLSRVLSGDPRNSIRMIIRELKKKEKVRYVISKIKEEQQIHIKSIRRLKYFRQKPIKTLDVDTILKISGIDFWDPDEITTLFKKTEEWLNRLLYELIWERCYPLREVKYEDIQVKYLLERLRKVFA